MRRPGICTARTVLSWIYSNFSVFTELEHYQVLRMQLDKSRSRENMLHCMVLPSTFKSKKKKLYHLINDMTNFSSTCDSKINTVLGLCMILINLNYYFDLPI